MNPTIQKELRKFDVTCTNDHFFYWDYKYLGNQKRIIWKSDWCCNEYPHWFLQNINFQSGSKEIKVNCGKLKF